MNALPALQFAGHGIALSRKLTVGRDEGLRAIACARGVQRTTGGRRSGHQRNMRLIISGVREWFTADAAKRRDGGVPFGLTRVQSPCPCVRAMAPCDGDGKRHREANQGESFG